MRVVTSKTCTRFAGSNGGRRVFTINSSSRLSWIQQQIIVMTILSLFSFTTTTAFYPSVLATSPQACPTMKMSSSDFCVMVNGMPGPMATATAEACLRSNLKLCPVALTGSQACTITVADTVTGRYADVRLIPNTDEYRNEIISALEGVQATAPQESNNNNYIMAIDYTHPSAVNQNARFYVEQKIPFVMGTTGGDREQLLKDCANHPCVIAPNMGKQIVALQAALEQFARDFPAAFNGYTLKVTESHQVTKADTSGTAKAIVASLNQLTHGETATSPFTEEDIHKIRNEQEALDFGVPADALKGHAFHTYTLTSPDGSVNFQLQHNVAGRTIYAEGTADAVIYLHNQLQKPDHENKIYTMIDVLKAGALE